MVVYVTSLFGSFVLINESFAVYASEERLCDKNGNYVATDYGGEKFYTSELVFETNRKKYIFPHLVYGLDYALEIKEIIDAWASSNQQILHIDLNKTIDFIEPELIGQTSLIVVPL